MTMKRGGRRFNAGRKAKAPVTLKGVKGLRPLDVLLKIMNDERVDSEARLKAAITAAPYVHLRRGQGGKRDSERALGKAAAEGKFAPGATPKLLLIKKNDNDDGAA
jgi:hypothetical protein